MTEYAGRELSLDEEIEIYQKEAKELLDNEQKGCEAPFANCIVRRGMRIIRKSKEIREKFTPKKPDTENINRGIDVSGEYDIDSNYICPSCKSVVGDYESEDIWYKHCPECGQAIKKE